MNAVKEQIRIIEIRFGWNDMHIALSKNGKDSTREELRDQFIDIFVSVEGEGDISPEPKVNLPSRGKQTQLGTRSKY